MPWFGIDSKFIAFSGLNLQRVYYTAQRIAEAQGVALKEVYEQARLAARTLT